MDNKNEAYFKIAVEPDISVNSCSILEYVGVLYKAEMRGAIFKAPTKTKSVIKVAKTSLLKVKPGKRKLTVKWKKISGVNGYQFQIALKKNFKKGLKNKRVKAYSSKGLIIKKLKKHKTYFVRARAYKSVSGRIYYGSWSSVKKAKTK